MTIWALRFCSNVALVDPESGRPTRTGYKFTEAGEKVRVSRGGTVIPFPEWTRKKPRQTAVGPKCTSESDVNKVTYQGGGFAASNVEM